MFIEGLWYTSPSNRKFCMFNVTLPWFQFLVFLINADALTINRFNNGTSGGTLISTSGKT